ncbi:hypothetical protein BAXH7_00211 [Bacillus amyloliquefaciens XH7]|nr:hypothetical protein BAXH7_00211 [Bacillus amyloliquefaciens XH7]
MTSALSYIYNIILKIDLSIFIALKQKAKIPLRCLNSRQAGINTASQK